MNWLDIVLTVGIIAVIALEANRGFERAGFDLLGLYIVLVVSGAVCEPLAQQLRLSGNHAAGVAMAYCIAFISFGMLALLVARSMSNNIDASVGMFERVMGAAAGMGVALVLAHAVVVTLHIEASTKVKLASTLHESVVGQEVLYFQHYHQTLMNLSRLTEPASSNSSPSVG